MPSVFKELPDQLIRLLSTPNYRLISLKTAALIDKSLCDGFICSDFLANYLPSRQTSVTINSEEFILRNNPIKSILEIYRMIFLQDRSFHVTISSSNNAQIEEIRQLDKFINSLFDKMHVSDSITRATIMAMREGLSFLHYDIEPSGIPKISVLSPIEAIFEVNSDRLYPDLSRMSYFGFQQLMSISSVRIAYDHPNLAWEEIESTIPIFVNQTGAGAIDPNIVSSTTSTDISYIKMVNTTAREENKQCLITIIYEREIVGDIQMYRKKVIYNSKKIIFEELFKELPIIPLYLSPTMELRRTTASSSVINYAPETIISPVRQLLITLNEIENTLYKYVRDHRPIRIANSNLLSSDVTQRLEDLPDFSSLVNLNQILKTTAPKASDAFALLYPVNIDPSLLTEYELVLNLIYQYTGITPDLRGEAPAANRQETDSLFRSRHALSISRINLVLDRCSSAIVSLAQHFVNLLTYPIEMRKLGIPHLVSSLTGYDVDASSPNFQWAGLFNLVLITTKRGYDTVSEIHNISIAKLVEGGTLPPQIMLKLLPGINQADIEKLLESDKQTKEQESQIEQMKAETVANQVGIDAQLRQLEIEERAKANENKTEIDVAKVRLEEMRILADILLTDSEKTDIDSSIKQKTKSRFTDLLQQKGRPK